MDEIFPTITWGTAIIFFRFSQTASRAILKLHVLPYVANPTGLLMHYTQAAGTAPDYKSNYIHTTPHWLPHTVEFTYATWEPWAYTYL